MRFYKILSIILFFTSIAYQINAKERQGGKDMSMVLKSSAFTNGAGIPVKFTCDGDDVSPELKWSDIPQGAKSFVIIADDPDAPMGTWVHWVVYDIPSNVMELSENLPTVELLDNGAKQGINDFGKIGYGGPCPPSGTHRYFFKLYALDIILNKEAGLSKQKILSLIKGHILAEAVLMGIYSRH